MRYINSAIFLLTILTLLSVNTMGQKISDKEFYRQLQEDLDLFSTDSLLGEKVWGLATFSVVNLRGEARHASELVSQITMGTPVKLIESTEGWYRVETPEGYNGWIDTCGLKLATHDEMELWKSLNRYVYNSISGYAYESPSLKANVAFDVVLGDIFVARDKKKGFLRVTTPDGRVGFVKEKECIQWAIWSQKKPNIQEIISTTQKMNGVPYLWGGTSSKAVDCSGLVKIAFFAQGIILERDASQQARNGEVVDYTEAANLSPGDLIFFGMSPEKITHVGIYIGNGNYIHSSGYVHINNIDPNHPNFNFATKKHIVAARRIINSLNTNGIIEVRNHPWYSFEP
ncbi:MAG TPA: SH3 domain-containing C40 family peptidase [Prolixibacteraceae bacterium]|nr:SH3 domain-containing C40 family peptidase [Prolixibacteraceae bacterium]